MKETLKILFFIICLWHPLPTLGQRGDVPDTPEAPLSSLIFVFDVTKSMAPELGQVKRGALRILKQLSQNKEQVIHDYILVPFNDPKVGPVTQTTNATKFDQVLRGLQVEGGGDCPEKSLTAILKGLQMGRPESFLFVFTDANPNDPELLPDILEVIAYKKTKVIFVLSGYCHKLGPSLEYEEIKTTSGGLIHNITKTDITEVLNFMQFNLKSRRVNLVTADLVDDRLPRNKRDLTYNVPVDETVNELVLSLVTGRDTVMKVTNPSGDVFTNTSFCKTYLQLNSTKLCSIENPELGIWKLLLKAVSSLTLRVSASSNITFDFGFEVFQNQSAVANKALCEPVKGAENTFIIKLNNTSQIASLTSGEVISLEGQTVGSFPLQSVQNKIDLYHGSFMPINNSYHLRINGETKSGLKFQRVTSVAFSSNFTHDSTNCTARNIQFIPQSVLHNSPPKLENGKQSWTTYMPAIVEKLSSIFHAELFIFKCIFPIEFMNKKNCINMFALMHK